MKRVNFAIGIHNHQPTGNFDFVFEEALNKSYRPFLEVLKKHPWMKMTLHYSGCLLEWMLHNHPEVVHMIRLLAQRGQVEIMSGGYYEPILAVLPDRDKLGQIEKLNVCIQEQFACIPRGMWLAERIWEPHLAGAIHDANIEYVVVDDAHFKMVGLEEEKLNGYYVTEEQGKSVKVFPISKKLRYYVPFEVPEKTIEHLAEYATEEGDNLVVLADDGEKFGIWPQTYQSVYEEKWLERFFKLLKKNEEWINLVTFSEYIDRYGAKGRIYLPCASYNEMMEWALFPQAGQRYQEVLQEMKASGNLSMYSDFVKGGFWRNFLVKYPEANTLHKKMLEVSDKVACMPEDDISAQEAHDELWQGQCNDSYWHGVFGGLYMAHLRDAAYSHLIRAENIADRILHTEDEWIEAETVDFDMDGRNEVLINTPLLNLYFSPDGGGSLFELDYRPGASNLTNIISRRKENYHDKIIEFVRNKSLPLDQESEKAETIHNIVSVKEEGLEKYLKYDWYRRASFLDHFLQSSVDLKSFYECDYGEAGDFVNQPYSYSLQKQQNSVLLRLSRNGNVWVDNEFVPIGLEKVIVVDQSLEVSAHYVIVNKSKKKVSLWFGVEFGFMGTSGNDDKCYYEVAGRTIVDRKLSSIGEKEKSKGITIVDGYKGVDISLAFENEADIWRFPLETISQSESGFEKSYQGSILFPNWKIELTNGKSWQTTIHLALNKKGKND
ncbi:MAG: alpha-amylase/4-alpha-glucanotransferase domain-containing protein [bacterium]